MDYWADLPDDLLEPVFERLSIRDYLRAAAVCRQWRATQTAQRALRAPSPPPSKLRLPWLILCGESARSDPAFHSIFEGRAYKLRIPLQHSMMFASLHGWVLVAPIPMRRAPYLLNPVSGAEIGLPRLPRIADDDFFRLVLLSAPPGDGCVVMVTAKKDLFLTLIGGGDGGGGGTRAGVWTSVPLPNPIFSAVAVAGKFYGVDLGDYGSLIVINPLLPDPEVEVLEMELLVHTTLTPFSEPLPVLNTWLMECSGELLLVCYCSPAYSKRSGVRYEFFKADLERRAWVQLKNMDGDMVVFLNLSSAACIPRARLGGGAPAFNSHNTGELTELSLPSGCNSSSFHSGIGRRPAADIWYTVQRDEVAIFEGCRASFERIVPYSSFWVMPTL